MQAEDKPKRVSSMITLDRLNPSAATPQHLYDRNIAPYGAFDSKGYQHAINARQRRRDHSSFKFNQLSKHKAEISDLKRISHPLVYNTSCDH